MLDKPSILSLLPSSFNKFNNTGALIYDHLCIYTLIGQPDDYLDNEDCLSILTSYGRAGLLNDGQCHDKKGYICQTGNLLL